MNRVFGSFLSSSLLVHSASTSRRRCLQSVTLTEGVHSLTWVSLQFSEIQYSISPLLFLSSAVNLTSFDHRNCSKEVCLCVCVFVWHLGNSADGTCLWHIYTTCQKHTSNSGPVRKSQPPLAACSGTFRWPSASESLPLRCLDRRTGTGRGALGEPERQERQAAEWRSQLWLCCGAGSSCDCTHASIRSPSSI